MRNEQVLLNPGPANTTDSVKLAQVQPDICPRETDFTQTISTIRHFIQANATEMSYDESTKKYSTVLFGSSGTGAIEAVLSSLPSNAKLLIITNGEYGRRAFDIAKCHGLYVRQIDFGDLLIDYDLAESELSKDSYTHAYVVHCETTTGVLNDLSKISSICGKQNVSLIVDAMSTFGCYDIKVDRDNVDFLIASSNKCVQGMAGVSFVIAKLTELQKMKGNGRTYYFDLYDQYEYLEKTGQTRFTPPVQTMFAFLQALSDMRFETIAARYERYKRLHNLMNFKLACLGFKTYTPHESSSVIITSFYDFDNENYSFEKMHDFLYERGFTIYPGKISKTNTFRIATIGNLTEDDIERFGDAMRSYINTLK